MTADIRFPHVFDFDFVCPLHEAVQFCRDYDIVHCTKEGPGGGNPDVAIMFADAEQLQRFVHVYCDGDAERIAETFASCAESAAYRACRDRHECRAVVWKRSPYPDCPEGEWVLEISGAINDCSFISRHTEPLSTPSEDVAGLPSLYACLGKKGMKRHDRLIAEGTRVPKRILAGKPPKIVENLGKKTSKKIRRAARRADLA